MKTVDLMEKKQSLEELLKIARSEAVLIHSAEGIDFLLEEADEFEREVATLGNSEKFMTFLERRSKERSEVPASEIANRLGITTS